MTSRQISGVAPDARDIAQETLDAFAESLEGTLLYSGDEGFTEATMLWNGMIQKRPAVVVRPRSVQDVVMTVGFIRDNALELSIKGGGHNIAGLALSDGGVTLDMSAMAEIVVDAAARTARVGPGCTLGEADRATQEHGLAATLGFVSATGIAGLTLGGGFGYLTRRFGWTVDDLDSVEIVTADGVVRRASRTENVDLVAGGSAERRATFWTSIDGVVWDRLPDDPMFHGSVYAGVTGLAAAHGAIVAVGSIDHFEADDPSARTWWSADGVIWAQSIGEPYLRGRADAVTATRDGFLAILQSPRCLGQIWTSSDGREWVCVVAEPALMRFLAQAVAASGSIEVAVGYHDVDEPPDLGLPGAAWRREVP